MDTRSVVRSHRRSARLTGQPPQDQRFKRSTTGKRRDSDHDTSSKNNSDASREGSCLPNGSGSKASSHHDNHLAIPDINTPKTVVKADDEGLVLPLFPNLRSSKAKRTQSPEVQTDNITVPRKDSVHTSSDKATKGRVSTKWVKTERGSIRLASDSEAEGMRNNAEEKPGEVEEGQHASSATARRRSRRLASMTPDVGDETTEVEPFPSRPAASKTKAIATTASAPDAAGSTAEQDLETELEPDLQDLPTRATSEHDPTTHPTHHDELPIHGAKTARLLQRPEVLQNTSPIPELVADIEKIVQSSPMAGGNLADDGARDRKSSTPAEALKKRAPLKMATRSRTLRSSSRSIENTIKTGAGLGSEKTDSESSQFDGAFDDIRGRRKKKALAADGTANTPKPREPRGTKRSAKELSQDDGNGNIPRLRQRRKPNIDVPKAEVDLSSANPIETATSRDAFVVDHPEVEAPVDIGEFARRSDEPANPVMLAQMLSTNPERADSDIDSTAADYGSEGVSQRLSPEADSTAADDGSEGVSQRLSPVPDTARCADCGRAPERYLICAKCKEAIYCGKYCQIWNWPLHRYHCMASDQADQAEVDLLEAYMADIWAAALKMLREENIAGGTPESVLLGEAVRNSHTRQAIMGQRSARGFVGFDVDASQSTPGDPQAVDRTRAISLRLAQVELGSDE
ncbi:hypothetical protein SLS64_008751 [Diaporthe eres]|uniref:MYND-type domain-containing protein n=1 Tax=Diaporthe eres TaxID=83184 RepID=A0ABR1NXF5_DIAER